MRRSFPRFATVIVSGIAIASSGLALTAAAAEVTVTVGHSTIDPSSVKLEAGDTIVFHNLDEMPGGHTIAADDGSFSSPPLAKDEKWNHTFETPGTHKIHIQQHPNVRGEIVVE